MTFIFHKVYHKPFESPMLHFMAVLGIDEENNRLKEANDYSYMLAGLVYCTRVIGLEILLPSKSRTRQADAEYESFLQQRKQFLADGSMNVASNMISLLAYSKHIALNHGNAGSVFWIQEGRIMKLHGAQIVMEKFKWMIGQAIGDAEDLFWQRLMWTTNSSGRLVIDIDNLTDDITFRRRDAYFVDNKHNRLASKWEDVTMDRLLMSRHGKKMYRDGKWHTRMVREYLREVDKFRKLLLFCVHVTGGQPARGTEILSFRFKNGCVRDRNIFILDGHVMAVTFYNKTESEWDIPKVVPRFLPWRVGQLLSLYLVYVQPLAESISVKTGIGFGWSEYIWADNKGPWETPKLTSILRQRSAEGIGHALGTLQFRHAAVGIGRQFVGDKFGDGYKDETGEVEEPEVEEEEDPLEISAGRGSAVGAKRYAVRSDIVRHLSQRNIDTFRPLSESWHRFLGLQSRKGGVQVRAQKRKGGGNGDPGGEEGEHLLDRRLDDAGYDVPKCRNFDTKGTGDPVYRRERLKGKCDRAVIAVAEIRHCCSPVEPDDCVESDKAVKAGQNEDRSRRARESRPESSWFGADDSGGIQVCRTGGSVGANHQRLRLRARSCATDGRWKIVAVHRPRLLGGPGYHNRHRPVSTAHRRDSERRKIPRHPRRRMESRLV